MAENSWVAGDNPDHERFLAIKQHGEAEARAIAAQMRVLGSPAWEVGLLVGRPEGAPCTCAYCANARALAWARSPAGTPYGAVE